MFSRLGKPSASVRRVVANDEFYEGYKSWRIITLHSQLAALQHCTPLLLDTITLHTTILNSLTTTPMARQEISKPV